MSTTIDEARPAREGEELDEARLREYLCAQLGQDIGEIEIRQFPGGHSNLTYSVRWPNPDQEGQELCEYVLRRPPFGSKVKRAHDMGREHRVLSKLAPVYPKAPKPLLFCDDHEVLGCDFYLMERVRGVIMRRKAPEGVELDETLARQLCESLLDALVEFHGLDYQAIGLGDLGKPDGFVERQVTGWTKRYAAAKTEEVPEIDEVAQWLANNMPQSSAATMVHNDYKFDNVVLAADELTRIIGILDWEMCTLGDPLVDLGTTLAYWIEKGDNPILHKLRFGPTHLPGMMTRAEVAESYAEKSGRDISAMPFYYCFGLFKTAVVLQQIYYRYVHGHTKDERFANLGFGVRALAHQAGRAIAQGKISW